MSEAKEKPESKPTEQKNKFILPSEEWLPEKEILPIKFRAISQQIQDMPILENDVWVVTFPKSGTTWMQETVWLLTHQLNFDMAKKLPLKDRSVMLEESAVLAGRGMQGLTFENTLKRIESAEKPRTIKTHIFYDKLPKALRDPKSPGKIVYVARNPKDVCISLFYFYRMLRQEEYHEAAQTLEYFVDFFITDRVSFGPFWTHVLEFWKRRNDPNILFVKYEDMKANLSGVLDKLQEFLEVPPLTSEQKQQLIDHLSFDKMKKNGAVNNKNSGFFRETYLDSNEETNFLRKGVVGDWKNKLSPEQVKRFDEWIARNTAGTDYSVDGEETKI